MIRTKLLAAGLSAVAVTVAVAAPLAYAQSNNEKRVIAETQTTVNSETRAEKIETKRTEIKARLDALKQERGAALDEKRLAACEKKAEKINSIIQKRSTQGTKHLAVFKKIADRVQQFVTDKELTIENYDALVATITDKEQAATAAIEENTATVFDCESADGSDPGKVARASVLGVRDALKDYRTAIKDLIVKVKSSNATKEDSGTEAESSETTTETEASGEGQ